jgi:hypothetical protein
MSPFAAFSLKRTAGKSDFKQLFLVDFTQFVEAAFSWNRAPRASFNFLGSLLHFGGARDKFILMPHVRFDKENRLLFALGIIKSMQSPCRAHAI